MIYTYNFSYISVANRTCVWGPAKPHVTVTVPAWHLLWVLVLISAGPHLSSSWGEPRCTPEIPSQAGCSQGCSVNIDFAAGSGAQRWLSCSQGKINPISTSVFEAIKYTKSMELKRTGILSNGGMLSPYAGYTDQDLHFGPCTGPQLWIRLLQGDLCPPHLFASNITVSFSPLNSGHSNFQGFLSWCSCAALLSQGWKLSICRCLLYGKELFARHETFHCIHSQFWQTNSRWKSPVHRHWHPSQPTQPLPRARLQGRSAARKGWESPALQICPGSQAALRSRVMLAQVMPTANSGESPVMVWPAESKALAAFPSREGEAHR